MAALHPHSTRQRIPVVTDSDCPTCCGTSITFVDIFTRSGEHHTVEVACPDCDGANVVEREPAECYSETGVECSTEVRQ